MSAQSQAKTADMNQPLHIQAGSVEIREQDGISIYKDNVLITRGTILDARRQVHMFADDAVVGMFFWADIAHQYVTGIDADTHFQLG